MSIISAPPMLPDIIDYITDLEKRFERLDNMKHKTEASMVSADLYSVVIADLTRIKNRHKKDSNGKEN